MSIASASSALTGRPRPQISSVVSDASRGALVKQVVDEWMTLAEEALASGRAELDAGRYSFAINRAYYAAFYAVSAVLLSQGRHFVKHAGRADGPASRPRPYRSAGAGARQSVRQAVRAPADRRLHGHRHRCRPSDPLAPPSGSARRRDAPAVACWAAISLSAINVTRPATRSGFALTLGDIRLPHPRFDAAYCL